MEMVEGTLTVGTSVATGSAVESADEAGRDVVERRNRHLAAFGQRESATMRWAGAIIFGSALAVMAHGGLALWRVIGVAAIIISIQIVHAVLLRRELTSANLNRRFLVLTVTGQLSMVGSATLTGGMCSPLVPALMMPILMSMIFFGPRGVTWKLTTLLAVTCGIMAVLPLEVTGPTLPRQHMIAATLIGLTWSLFGVHMLVTMLHRASHAALRSLDAARAARVEEAEDQTRRMKTIGSRVAHELKNPLTAIKGLIQLVARTPESDRTQERLAVVQSEITRMQSILDEYLSFARPLEDLRLEAVDLAALAGEVAGVLSGRLEQGGIRVELDLGVANVQADPRRMRDAITNLVTNAIEATPRGGLVRLRTHLLPRGAGARLEVEDSGRGIPPADMERLGSSYFTTRVGGTGLGVVLVQGVVAQHGGELTYESAVGRGTLARIDVPLVPPSRSAAALPDCGADPVACGMPAPPAERARPTDPPCLGTELRRRIVERRT